MFTSKRKLFSSERGSATSWLAGITSAALILAAVALPATATEGDGLLAPESQASETILTPEEIAAAEAAAAAKAAEEQAAAEAAAAAKAAEEQAAAEAAAAAKAAEEQAAADSAANQPPAPEDFVIDAPLETTVPAPEDDGTAPDNNSPPVEVSTTVPAASESTTAPTPKLAPTIQSDKADYAPGSFVTLTGTNWQAGQSVNIFVDDNSDNGWSHESTTDPIVEDSGEGAGTFTYGFTLPSWFVATYRVVATGSISGRAETTFTDGIPVDFRQCANKDAGYPVGDCHWINSIVQSSNARYVEGMSVPQRTIFTAVPATPGNIHKLTFDHDATQTGSGATVHAFDFLTSWEQADQAADYYDVPLDLQSCGPEPASDPQGYLVACNNVVGGLYFDDAEVPDDPFISGLFGSGGDGITQTRIDAYEAQYGNRTIRIWGNAPITDAALTLSHDVGNGLDTSNSKINYVLTYTSTATQVVIEFAGHLAVGYDGTDLSWGTLAEPGFGPGVLSGGAYHHNLRTFTDTNNKGEAVDASLGAQDNQIKSDAIISPGIKTGMKFLDKDADGNYEPAGNDGNAATTADNDTPIEGWTIKAFANSDNNTVLSAAEFADGAVRTATTNESGVYLMLLDPGNYIVCEVQQTGYTETFPKAATTNSADCSAGTGLAKYGWKVVLGEAQVDSGNDFGNASFADKSGYKWHDLNADGIWQKGADGKPNTGDTGEEPGLGGWTIWVDYNDNGVVDDGEPSAVTSSTAGPSLGSYALPQIQSGTWKVHEKGPLGETGWKCAYPTTSDAHGCYHQETFVAGQSYPDNDFGNYRPGTKSGVKFEDENANGTRDDGELGLINWVIRAYVDANKDGVLQASETTIADSDTTLADGSYELSLDPGKYVVCEVSQTGWTQSAPDNTKCALGTGLEPGGYALTMTSGDTTTHVDNNFGNYRPGTKSGVKFEDKNANGTKDDGELGLINWVIRAYVDANKDGVLQASETTIADSDTTLADGSYELSLDPGKYVVCEVSQAGWTQSAPDNTKCALGTGLEPGGYALTMTSGDTTTHVDNDFGNYQTATKSGTKFIDEDADGVVGEAGEAGKSGVVINAYKDVNGNGTFDPATESTVVATDTTDVDGDYSLTLNPGKYWVCEVGTAGWTQSYPANDDCADIPGVEDGGWYITLTSGDADTGNNFGNWTTATKSGTKFIDEDADGVVGEAGEAGKSGVVINAYKDVNGNGTFDPATESTVVATDTTDVDGDYSLTLNPGKYWVCEVGTAGWTQSYPANDDCADIPGVEDGGWYITLTSGDADTGNNFGNWTTATKSGTKFIDEDADGVVGEAGEAGKSGVVINAYKDVNGNGTFDPATESTVVATDTTDVDGDYSLTLNPGKYWVCEVGTAGWTQSYPANDDCADIPGVEDGGWYITLTSGDADTGNNFGNWTTATKSGTKFIDEDADGVVGEAGEAGKSGVVINAYKDVNGNGTFDPATESTVVATDTTDVDGDYSLTLNPGKYWVCEVGTAGWTQSYPANDDCADIPGVEDGGWYITLTSGDADTGNNFGNWTTATKSGTKFIDEDADGVVGEAGEAGKSGVVINAYKDVNGNGTFDPATESTVVATDTTDVDGDYSLTLNPGKYWVCEVGTAGWTQSYPANDDCADIPGVEDGGWYITLTSGDADTGNNFGNWTTATKSGTKFIDEDADGVVGEAGEAGKSGVVINAYKDVNGNGTFDPATESTVVATDTTDVDGDYSLTLNPGKYWVCEVGTAGWTQSYPANDDCADIPGVEDGGWYITLTSGDADTGNNFGNWTTATKSGTKFIDEDADGVVGEAGEAGKSGVVINAYKDVNGNGTFDPATESTVVATDTTDVDGDYSLTLNPGKYWVCEVGTAGWTQSYPANDDCADIPGVEDGGWYITLTSGDADTGNNFGNWTTATKSGTKFIDEDADGVVGEAGEAGKSGVVINAYKDVNGNGTFDPATESTVVATDTTDVDGDYSLTLNPGKYWVCEVGTAGWTQSYPANDDCADIPGVEDGGWYITLTSGDADTGNNFGNWTTATKSGTKFIDEDADGVVGEAGEAGKSGVVINAYKDVNGNGTFDPATESTVVATDTTDVDGDYSLTLNPGKYWVCEVGTAGWTQSYPANDDCADIPGVEDGGWYITLTSGDADTGNNFGNWTTATKSGTKFIDEDADGVVGEAGEAGKSGVVINAYKDVNGNGTFDPATESTVVATDTTDVDGDYSLTLNPGKYWVCEVGTAGWTQSYPANDDCADIPGVEDGGWYITLTSGDADTGNNFGNWTTATKSGTKFIDEDADGVVGEAGEAGKSGVVINAYKDVNGNGTFDPATESTVVATDTTDVDGDYSLTLNPGKYWVCEVGTAGWTQSYPANDDCADIPGVEDGGWYITLTSGDADTGNNFGNWTTATKSGTKFIDEDADGVVGEAGEAGKSGVVINAYKDVNGNGTFDPATESTVVATDTTDVDGDYSLTLNPGKYWVCEVGTAGWTQSYPANDDCADIPGVEDGGWYITLTSGDADTGNNFGNWTTATKSGTKFIDEDADGVVGEAGEAGKSGVVINAYKDVNGNGTFDPATESTVVATDTTDVDGDYSLTLNPGKYWVCEVGTAGWTQSYPANDDCADIPGVEDGGWYITLTSGDADTGNNFGNWTTATKSGTKFIDEDADGVVGEAGEAGKSGVVINAYKDVNGNGTFDPATESTVVATDTTDVDGDYSLTLNPGKYWVCEVGTAGWTQSYPANDDCADIPGVEDGGWYITLTSGDADTGNNFGNWTTATKSGTKFIDEDADGVVGEAGEAGKSGVVINAYKDVNGNGTFDPATESTVVATDTTDVDGDYSLTLNPGKYWVCEVGTAGWTQSYPANDDCADIPGVEDGGWYITLTSGDADTGNNFGNWTTGTKAGYKWNDVSANGIWDTAEPGINGVTIQLWADKDSSGTVTAGDTVVATQLTANGGPRATDGYYAFAGITPGKYVVAEVCQTGWIQSAPAPIGGVCGTGVHPITVTSGFSDLDNNFGNYKPGVPTLNKTSDPVDQTNDPNAGVVAPETTITYFVTVGNTGGSPISGPVVDTIPEQLTVVPNSISDGGVQNGRTITWQVTLAPGATKTFQYQGVVDADAVTDDQLLNTVTFAGLSDQTIHVVEAIVAAIEEEVVAAEEEEIAATGAGNVGNFVGAALLAMLAGGLMVTFGRRRRNQG